MRRIRVSSKSPFHSSYSLHGLFVKGLQPANPLLISIAALTGAVSVYLAARRPEYLNGQHLVVNWDVEELELRNNELGTSDALKLRVLRSQSSG